MTKLHEQMKPMFDRSINARDNFISSIQEQFGFTHAESDKILSTFIKAKAVKLDWAMGRYDIVHGAFWSREVMERALES